MRSEWLLFCFFLFTLCQSFSFPSTTINWQTCSLFTPGSDPNSHSINNNVPKQIISWYQLFYSETEDISQPTATSAQCTFLNAKLNWTDASSTATIPLFIKKIASSNPTAKKGNLWLLNDGIGKANTFFEPFVQSFVNTLNSKYDIYITDFRGTGRSGLMDCFGVSRVNSRFEDFAASEIACRQDLKNRYGNAANFYTLTQAAYDLAFVMNATRDSSKIVVFAVGSASLWINRLVTLFPNFVDYVILDSPHSPLSVDIINRDIVVEEAAKNFLDLCQNDTFCSMKFAPYGGAYNATVNVLQKNRDYYGGCLGNMYRSDLLTQFMAQSLFYRFNRRLILPIIYRLSRCTKEDQNFLTNLQLYLKLQGYAMEFSNQNEQLQQTPDVNAAAYDSRALFSHIGLSECSQRPFPTVEEWTSNYENRYPPFLFRLRASPEYTKVANTVPINSTFYTEQLQYTFGSYTNDMAILYTNGNPVVNSNAVEEWSAEYPFATLVYLPNQLHNLLLTSTKFNNTANTTCGFDVVSDILLQVADSTGSSSSISLTTKCLMNGDTSLDEKSGIQYQISMDTQTYILLNHGDFWEGGPAMASIDIVRLVVALLTLGLIGAFFVGVVTFIVVFLLVVYRIAKRGM